MCKDFDPQSNNDCGEQQSHVKLNGFFPTSDQMASAKVGQQDKMVRNSVSAHNPVCNGVTYPTDNESAKKELQDSLSSHDKSSETCEDKTAIQIATDLSNLSLNGPNQVTVPQSLESLHKTKGTLSEGKDKSKNYEYAQPMQSDSSRTLVYNKGNNNCFSN